VHIALNEKADAIKMWEKCLELKDLSKREKKRRVLVEAKLKAAKEAK
jgi:hypothetical protein